MRSLTVFGRPVFRGVECERCEWLKERRRVLLHSRVSRAKRELRETKNESLKKVVAREQNKGPRRTTVPAWHRIQVATTQKKCKHYVTVYFLVATNTVAALAAVTGANKTQKRKERKEKRREEKERNYCYIQTNALTNSAALIMSSGVGGALLLLVLSGHPLSHRSGHGV